MSQQTPQPGVPRPVSTEDAKAALGAFAELGPQYSDEVVDAFMDKLNERLATPVEPAVAPIVAPIVASDVVRDRRGNPVRDKKGNIQFYPMQSTAVSPHSTSAVPKRSNEPSPFVQRVTILSIILGLSIPLTAIAGAIASLPGIFVVWTGIVIVSLAQAWSQKRD